MPPILQFPGTTRLQDCVSGCFFQLRAQRVENLESTPSNYGVVDVFTTELYSDGSW
jgi:hypothetical protein